MSEMSEEEIQYSLEQIYNGIRPDWNGVHPRKINYSFENLVTYQGAAKLLKKTKNAVKLLVKRGKLTPIEIGNINYLVRGDVLKYKPYDRKKEIDTLSEQGDKSTNLFYSRSNKKNNTFSEQGDKSVINVILEETDNKTGIDTSSEQEDKTLNSSSSNNNGELDTFSERGDKSVFLPKRISSQTIGIEPPNPFISTINNTIVATKKTVSLPPNNRSYSNTLKDLPLTVSQAANKLNVSSRRIISLIHKNRIRAKRVGSAWLISQNNFQAYFDEVQKNLQEEKLYQEKLAEHTRYTEEFAKLPYTDKLFHNLFAHNSPKWRTDSIKETFAGFLRGNLFSQSSTAELEVAKIAGIAEKFGIHVLLPDETDFMELADTMKKRIKSLRDGTYIRQYSKYQVENPKLLQNIRIAVDNIEHYQQILNQIDSRFGSQ